QITVKIPLKVGMVPVQSRVVEERNDIMTIAGVYKFPYQIPPGRTVGRVKLIEPAGVIKGKSLMMPGCEGNIFTSRLFGSQNQLIRVKILRGEGILQFTVFLSVHFADIPYPLAFAKL